MCRRKWFVARDVRILGRPARRAKDYCCCSACLYPLRRVCPLGLCCCRWPRSYFLGVAYFSPLLATSSPPRLSGTTDDASHYRARNPIAAPQGNRRRRPTTATAAAAEAATTTAAARTAAHKRAELLCAPAACLPASRCLWPWLWLWLRFAGPSERLLNKGEPGARIDCFPPPERLVSRTNSCKSEGGSNRGENEQSGACAVRARLLAAPHPGAWASCVRRATGKSSGKRGRGGQQQCWASRPEAGPRPPPVRWAAG